MKKRNLFILTIVVAVIIYTTLFLLIEDFEQSKIYYQSMILVGGITGILINLFPVKSDNDEHSDNIKKTMSKKKKIIIISITIVLIVAIIWILGVVDL